MTPFVCGHATHPDWRMALSLAAAQVDAQHARQEGGGSGPLTLGFAYFTDAYVPHAQALLAALKQRWPGVAWVGSVGVGVAASGVEYLDEPALVLLLGALPAGRFEVFSGARPLARIEPYSALVHADPATPELAELIVEMSDRTASGYLFGGLASSRAGAVHLADGVFTGGLSGVAFSADVPLVSRVTQGCQPVGPVRAVTAAERNIVVELDGRPAMPLLLEDLGIGDLANARAALPRLRRTLVGLSDGDAAPLGPGRQFGPDVRVRHLIGLDPGRNAVALADLVEPGMRLAFCARDAEAARRDLVRICSEIREEVEAPSELAAAGGTAAPVPAASRIRGALYISCAGRGGPHFGGPSAELKIVQRALGDVPLAGFFAGGEIARHHLYGYTGVLTVFTQHA
ncbi:MAG: FIST C-terminal domain-containing protein [Rubrivivax sp.]